MHNGTSATLGRAQFLFGVKDFGSAVVQRLGLTVKGFGHRVWACWWRKLWEPPANCQWRACLLARYLKKSGGVSKAVG